MGEWPLVVVVTSRARGIGALTRARAAVLEQRCAGRHVIKLTCVEDDGAGTARWTRRAQAMNGGDTR